MRKYLIGLKINLRSSAFQSVEKGETSDEAHANSKVVKDGWNGL